MTQRNLPGKDTPRSDREHRDGAPGLNVLIVDDDRSITRTLAVLLELEGHRAVVARSEQDALQKAADIPFDCVLSDVRMGEDDGLALYRALKAQRPSLPVVLMTAYAEPDLVEQSLSEGVLAVLDKPLNIDALLAFLLHLQRARATPKAVDDGRLWAEMQEILRRGTRGTRPALP